MSQITIWHKVKDYSAWKAGFDNDEERRNSAGMKLIHVGPGKIDPNSAVVIMEADDAEEKMSGMIADPELKAKMEEAGVIEFNYSIN